MVMLSQIGLSTIWKPNEELNEKTNISIFINLRYLRLKLLKNKENNKKICHIFHHNFKNIPCYVMSEVSLKRFYFALFDDGLTLKNFEIGIYRFLNSNSSNVNSAFNFKHIRHNVA